MSNPDPFLRRLDQLLRVVRDPLGSACGELDRLRERSNAALTALETAYAANPAKGTPAGERLERLIEEAEMTSRAWLDCSRRVFPPLLQPDTSCSLGEMERSEVDRLQEQAKLAIDALKTAGEAKPEKGTPEYDRLRKLGIEALQAFEEYRRASREPSRDTPLD
jgi:hypothetical protein